jgi:hypothetical protein
MKLAIPVPLRICSLALAAALLALAAPSPQALSQGRPAALPQPSEAQMGVPTYPGARYDGMNSGGMSQDERYYWIFITQDPVDKVVAFYREKTKLTPTETAGSYSFTLKGGDNPYFPDHGVMIQKNTMFPPPTGTVITVSKLK